MRVSAILLAALLPWSSTAIAQKKTVLPQEVRGTDPKPDTDQALRLLRSAHYPEAIQQAKLALGRDEKYVPAMMVMAKGYYYQHKFELANTVIEIAKSIDKSCAECFNLQGFIACAKANQAKLQFGSAVVGGSNHLGCLLLNTAIGIEVAHVPYRSGAQALQDTLAGRIDYQCPSLPVALPQINAGTVKALATLSKSRSASLPQLPSAQEQGLAGFDVAGWYALFLQAATPDNIVHKLNRALLSTLATPSVRHRLQAIGCDLFPPDRSSPEYLRGFAAAEIARWAKVIKASSIELQ